MSDIQVIYYFYTLFCETISYIISFIQNPIELWAETRCTIKKFMNSYWPNKLLIHPISKNQYHSPFLTPRGFYPLVVAISTNTHKKTWGTWTSSSTVLLKFLFLLLVFFNRRGLRWIHSYYKNELISFFFFYCFWSLCWL